MDFRKTRRADLVPVFIDGEAVEKISRFKCLKFHITEDFWAIHLHCHCDGTTTPLLSKEAEENPTAAEPSGEL